MQVAGEAGETKGVSRAQVEYNRRRLEALCKLEGNRLCADCRLPLATWASINCGVFICQVRARSGGSRGWVSNQISACVFPARWPDLRVSEYYSECSSGDASRANPRRHRSRSAARASTAAWACM